MQHPQQLQCGQVHLVCKACTAAQHGPVAYIPGACRHAQTRIPVIPFVPPLPCRPAQPFLHSCIASPTHFAPLTPCPAPLTSPALHCPAPPAAPGFPSGTPLLACMPGPPLLAHDIWPTPIAVLNQLNKEKVDLENRLEAEQEYVVNKLCKQVRYGCRVCRGAEYCCPRQRLAWCLSCTPMARGAYFRTSITFLMLLFLPFNSPAVGYHSAVSCQLTAPYVYALHIWAHRRRGHALCVYAIVWLWPSG